MPTSTDVTPRRPADSARATKLTWLAALGLLAFALHTALVLAGGWQWLDLALLQGAQRLHGPGADAFFLRVSALGHEWGVIPLDVLLVLGLALCRRWPASGFVLLATAGSGALNVLLKALFMRERPQLWPRLAEVQGWSFPSGHAMGSATLMLLLVIWAWPGRWRYRVLCAAVLFALLVGSSRVYLRVHWPSDVVAGWLLAAAWVLGVAAWMPRQWQGELCHRTDIS